VNGVYDALRVLISGHRPLVCASIAFGHGRQSERTNSSRAKLASGKKAESFAVRGPANPDTVGASVAPSALSSEPNLV